jgi:hypothetical protein
MKLTPTEALAIQDFLTAKAREIVLAKRQDYSGKGDPFANLRMSEFVGVEPWRGCMVRLMDKLSRIRHIMEAGGEMQVQEALIDTFADIHNYTDILAGLVFEVLGLPDEITNMLIPTVSGSGR